MHQALSLFFPQTFFQIPSTFLDRLASIFLPPFFFLSYGVPYIITFLDSSIEDSGAILFQQNENISTSSLDLVVVKEWTNIEGERKLCKRSEKKFDRIVYEFLRYD